MVRSVFSVSDGIAVIFYAFENVPEPWKISGASVAGASGRDPQPQRRTVAEMQSTSAVFFIICRARKVLFWYPMNEICWTPARIICWC